MNATDPRSNALRNTIIFCLLTALCEGIDLQVAGVAMPGIGAEFKPGADQVGTFFSASTFGLFFGAVIGGRLADSVGRKRVLIVSVGLFGLFSLLTAPALTMDSLTLARLFTGLGLGGALPMMLALVSETAVSNRQSATVAMVYAATPLGGAVASLISMMIPAAQWRWLFIVGGVVPLLLVPFMARGLPESAAFRRARESDAAIAAARGIPGNAAREPKRGSFAAVFADGRALVTVLLWISFFLGLLLLYLLLNWLPTLLASHGLTHYQAAGAQIGFNLGGAIAALLIGHLLGGPLRNTAIIATFLALPLVLIALAKAPAEVAPIVIIVFVLGCAVIAAQAFLYAMAPVGYPTAIRGVGVGLAVAVGRIGSIAGPKLGGILKAAGHGPSRLLMDLLPIVIAGSCCALLLAWCTLRPKALTS